MLQDIENAFVTECRKQGLHPNTATMNQLAIDYAGSVLNGGFIVLPSQHSIAMKDAVRDLAQRFPQIFNDIDPSKKDPRKSSGNLTLDMQREIFETRRNRALPSDWTTVRDRVNGKTAEMMDAIAANRKGAA